MAGKINHGIAGYVGYFVQRVHGRLREEAARSGGFGLVEKSRQMRNRSGRTAGVFATGTVTLGGIMASKNLKESEKSCGNLLLAFQQNQIHQRVTILEQRKTTNWSCVWPWRF